MHGLEYPGHSHEAKRGLMSQQGRGLDLVSEQKRIVVLDMHVEIEEVGSTGYMFCGDVDCQSVKMSFVTRG